MHGIDSVSGDRRQVRITAGAVHVVDAAAAGGSIARYHVADQSTSRTRIVIPTGAKAYRVLYTARRSAGVEDATGEVLRVVENITGTTEAGTALGEAAASPGAEISGVSYTPVPINFGYSAGFDEGSLLYYLDFLTEVAETGDSDVYVELTL